jgi:hypothetical protein
MKVHPILFSTPMVQAILAGKKTQTRRIIKPQPDINGLHNHTTLPMSIDSDLEGWHGTIDQTGESKEFKCPYGKEGDTLWVRETFAVNDIVTNGNAFIYKANLKEGEEIRYFDLTKKKWKPSIFMPRAASRITLQIIDIRVERLQDISDEDAKSEGVKPVHCESNKDCTSSLCKIECQGIGEYYNYLDDEKCEGDPCYGATESFESLWKSINGHESWNSNPFVWVVEFKRIS